MDYKYVLVESSYLFYNMERRFYGIAVVDSNDGITILEYIADITSDCDLLKTIVDQCNALKICMEHLVDVVEDFLDYDT